MIKWVVWFVVALIVAIVIIIFMILFLGPQDSPIFLSIRGMVEQAIGSRTLE